MLFLLLVLALGTWLFFTPHLTARRMMRAAQDRDAETLSEMVDYPALRTSLKANFNAIMLSEMADGQKQGDGFAALGAGMASMFTDKIIDSMVTPEGLSMMLQRSAATNSANAANAITNKTSLAYRGLNTFAVRVKAENPDDEGELIFKRHGLANWKLSALRLPTSKTQKKASTPQAL